MPQSDPPLTFSCLEMQVHHCKSIVHRIPSLPPHHSLIHPSVLWYPETSQEVVDPAQTSRHRTRSTAQFRDQGPRRQFQTICAPLLPLSKPSFDPSSIEGRTSANVWCVTPAMHHSELPNCRPVPNSFEGDRRKSSLSPRPGGKRNHTATPATTSTRGGR